MAELRWGSSAPADAAEARERLIDAAEACVARVGVGKTTAEAIAGEALVSRATLYRYFDSRDELLLAVVLRELARSSEPSLGDFVRRATSPSATAAAIVEACASLIRTIRRDPLLHAFLEPDAAATITGASQAFFHALAAELVPHLAELQSRGFVRDDIDPADASEWILRSILSLLTVEGPVPRRPADERRLLEHFLVPAIVPNPGAPVDR